MKVDFGSRPVFVTQEKLAAIKEAMEKLANGEYGIREECGEEIGQGGLKAMPLAKLCVSCQEESKSHPLSRLPQ